MEICIKWNICRVCLKEGQKTPKKADVGNNIELVNLFTVNKKLPNQIFELSGVSMEPDDYLPDKICTKCLATVNNAVQLRELCRSSNTYLQSIVERTKSASAFPKPVTTICQVVDYDYNTDVALENRAEHDVEQQKDNVEICHKKSEDGPEKQAEVDVNDISHYTVELEEIIEMSGDEAEFYAEAMTDDEGIPITMFEKMVQNSTENPSSNESEENTEKKKFNAKDANLVERVKVDETVSNNSQCDSIKNEDTISEKSIEYGDEGQEENTELDVNESVINDFQDQIQNDSEDLAQVSSTVGTKYAEYYEDNSNTSNMSNDLVKEPRSYGRLVLKKYPTIVVNKKPRLRMKRNLFKATGNDPVQVYACKICGNRFANQTKLNFHMKFHLQAKNHQCEICFKSFITACNLQAHMRIHTGEKPYECYHCGRRFNDRSSHIRHERTHTKEKPFKCSECGRDFSLSTTLQNHMKTHSNERSYSCEPCGKSFKLRHHLKTHQNTTLHRAAVQVADDDEY